MPRRLIACLLLALSLALAGCASAQDARQRVRADVHRREAKLRAELRQRRAALRRKVQEVLAQVRRALPRAQRTSPQVQSRGRVGPESIDAFLTDVLGSVDAYWTKTFRASGLPQPHIAYDWVAPGDRVATPCGVADDSAAFYCAGDDTIFVSQEFASELWRGVVRGLPGQQAGYGHAAGDFGVAYVVAHEYGHNVQDELGLFTVARSRTAEPFELQADCFAGLWGNSVYKAGRLQPGDVQEAIDTALAVGDFDYASAQHHGTPEQRRSAWLTGFRSGDPSVCSRYVPAT